MVKFYTLIALLAITFFQAQEITLHRNGKKFTKNGIEYKLSEYKTEFSNPIAKNYIREGRSQKTTSFILGFCGGLFMAAGLPNALSKDQNQMVYNNGYIITTKASKPGWYMIAGGGVLIATAIPLAHFGNKKIRKGVETENKFGSKSQTSYQLHTNGNTLGVTVNF